MLVVRACRYGLAVDAEYYDVVCFYLFCAGAFYYVKYYVLGKFVVLSTVCFKLFYLFLEVCCLFRVAYDFYYLTSCGHTQLGKQIPYQLHVAVVYAVEADRIDVVYYYDAFYHVAC